MNSFLSRNLESYALYTKIFLILFVCQTLCASESSVQSLVITVPQIGDLLLRDSSLEFIFDPMQATEEGLQALEKTSSYRITNTLSGTQMITANISEMLSGIDIFLGLGIPSPLPPGIMVSEEVKLSMNPQKVMSGIGKCIIDGSILYRVVADFSKTSDIALQQKVVTVHYTLGPSSSQATS